MLNNKFFIKRAVVLAVVTALVASVAFVTGCVNGWDSIVDGRANFSLIPAGTFSRNSTTISKSFYMSNHEVTQGEWKAVMGSNPSYYRTSSLAKGYVADNRPVENVRWFETLVYCNKRSVAEGLTPCYSIVVNGAATTDTAAWGTVPTSSSASNYATWNAVVCDWDANGYRLPTEAEWQYAAMGGESYRYAGSDDVDEVAWYTGTVLRSEAHHEVKKKKPNGFGLYDMSGNVWEWCWDWEDNYPYSDVTDPTGVASGSDRVNSGGSWDGDASDCTVSSRNYLNGDPYYRGNNIGFRVVCRP